MREEMKIKRKSSLSNFLEAEKMVLVGYTSNSSLKINETIYDKKDGQNLNDSDYNPKHIYKKLAADLQLVKM
jgi:hypothetical protein